MNRRIPVASVVLASMMMLFSFPSQTWATLNVPMTLPSASKPVQNFQHSPYGQMQQVQASLDQKRFYDALRTSEAILQREPTLVMAQYQKGYTELQLAQEAKSPASKPNGSKLLKTALSGFSR